MSVVATGLRPVAGRGLRQRRLFSGLLAALVALAWLALWGWSRSPYAGYLAHDGWLSSGPLADLCRAVPGGGVVVPVLVGGVAWVLMTTAMMLPTTLPLFDAFGRVVAGRDDRARLLLLLGLGYLAAWGAFGLLAHGAQALLLAAIGRVLWLEGHAWLIGTAVIGAAGAFQFSGLKYRCLEKCRTPLSFVIEHWRGRHEARQAFALGAHHGLFCVGCCWALMLVMFAVGMGNLGWMLGLAALMAIEKNLGWGRRLSMPLGVALLAWAAVLVLVHAR